MTESDARGNGHGDDADAVVRSTGEASDGVADLRVLQLTSSRQSFFEQRIAALEDRGIDCETVAVPAREGRERERGPREYLSFYLHTLGRSLETFDLVHVHYGLLGPLALAQPTRPLVLTLWGSDLMGPSWLARLSRLSARHSDAVVVPSKVLSRQLNCPHEVIPFGVDTGLFRPIPQEVAREHVGWSRDPDERVVLFPYAPDRPVKNYPLAEQVVKRVPNATLETVSGVPYEEMPYYMNASDALLITSERESGPMVIREATACNVPIVSRDVGFAAEVLAGVSDSYVAESEAELAACLKVAVRAGRSDGREVLDDLDPAFAARRLESVYRGAIDR